MTESGETAVHKRDLFGTVRRRVFTRNSTTEDCAERDTTDAARGLGWLARRLAAREARALEAAALASTATPVPSVPIPLRSKLTPAASSPMPSTSAARPTATSMRSQSTVSPSPKWTVRWLP